MRIIKSISSSAIHAAIVMLAAGTISTAAYADTTKGPTEVSAPSKVGTVTDWNWYEGIDVSEHGVGFHQKHFSYMTETGPVVGIVTNIMFTLDAPAWIVWKHMKDFNTFEGPFGIKYTGSWGDLYTSEEQLLGKRTLQYGAADGSWNSVPSEVIKVIPQNQLTLYETVPSDGSSGGVSPGFHTVLFTEFGGKTTVTKVLQHTARLTGLKSEIEGVRQADFGPLKYPHAQAKMWWIDQFPPLLRKLVAEDPDNVALKKAPVAKR